MVYKEPSNKAKLAKLKEDLLGDGAKESKLNALEKLVLDIKGGDSGEVESAYMDSIFEAGYKRDAFSLGILASSITASMVVEETNETRHLNAIFYCTDDYDYDNSYITVMKGSDYEYGAIVSSYCLMINGKGRQIKFSTDTYDSTSRPIIEVVLDRNINLLNVTLGYTVPQGGPPNISVFSVEKVF